MSPKVPNADTSLDGPETDAWRLGTEECPLLGAHGIAHVGLADTGHGYERVRLKPTGSFVLETLGGEGRILLEGRWQKTKVGDVALAPPRVLNAFFTPAGRRWKVAYARYDEAPMAHPLINSGSPLRIAGHLRLGRAIEGLRDEWQHERESATLRHWVALIDTISRRLASPWKTDDRLAQLWHLVQRDLAAPWTLEALALRSGFSAEHLRRICLKTLGRSPIEHLSYMRIHRAQEMLERGSEKIETIARAVGYASGHAFSRAFQRCVGSPPSDFRGRE